MRPLQVVPCCVVLGGLALPFQAARAACAILSVQPTGTIPTIGDGQRFSFVASGDCRNARISFVEPDFSDIARRGSTAGSGFIYSYMMSASSLTTGVLGATTLTWTASIRDASGHMTRVTTTNELDLDHDGWTRSEGDILNCDSFAQSYPGAPEVCDGLDNDCNGDVDEGDACLAPDLSVADAILLGESYGDSAGASVAGVGDIDSDGHDDVLIGAPGYSPTPLIESAGAAYLIRGPISGDFDLADADATLVGAATYDDVGWAVAGPGDVNGDGNDDLFVGAVASDLGATDAGAAYLVLGPVTGRLELVEADAVLIGEAYQDAAGLGVAGSGDVNGDGYADVLIGSTGNDDGGENAGAAYLVLGPVTGELSLADATAEFTGEDAGDIVGRDLSGAGDIDGDGFEDMLIGGRYSEGGAVPDSGAAYVVFGGDVASISLSAADAKIVAEETYDYSAVIRVAGAGDVDGDGHDDLLLGAEGNEDGGAGAGAAYLVLGPVSGDRELASADAQLTGESRDDYAGIVSSAGDLDADGHDDLLVGASHWGEHSDRYAGAVYVVLGPISGTQSLSAADRKFVGIRAGDQAGQTLSTAGDVDNDGLPDVLVGAIGAFNSTVGANTGAAYLLLDGGL